MLSGRREREEGGDVLFLFSFVFCFFVFSIRLSASICLGMRFPLGRLVAFAANTDRGPLVLTAGEEGNGFAVRLGPRLFFRPSLCDAFHTQARAPSFDR